MRNFNATSTKMVSIDKTRYTSSKGDYDKKINTKVTKYVILISHDSYEVIDHNSNPPERKSYDGDWREFVLNYYYMP